MPAGLRALFCAISCKTLHKELYRDSSIHFWKVVGVSPLPKKLSILGVFREYFPKQLGMIFYALSFLASKVTCGGTIQKNYGNFFSPNFPETYPNEAKCVWNITVTRGMRVTLNFSYFDIEYHSSCEYDYVKVNAINGTIGKYCGSRELKNNERIDKSPPIHTLIVSPNNWLEVILKTDYSNEKMERGFEGNFIGVDINECKDNNGGCDHNCFNGIGGRYCSCKIGYKLAKDGKSCKGK